MLSFAVGVVVGIVLTMTKHIWVSLFERYWPRLKEVLKRT